MSILGETRSLIADMFLTLPLLVMGFVFLFGTLTSNVGLLYLFLGQLILVPSLSYLSSHESFPFTDVNGESQRDWYKMATNIFTSFLTIGINGRALGGGNNYLLYLLLILPFLGQDMLEIDKSFMFFLNPIAWIRSYNNVNDEAPLAENPSSAKCAMVPDTAAPRRNPSTWISHMTFLFGFILANASAIYNEPAPIVYEKDKKGSAENIRLLVNNRKTRAVYVMVAAVVLFLTLFALRYSLSHCEGSFLYNMFPILFTGLTGASWFNILYNDCGVRPADILGIVQGMVSPNMVNNPIICVGD